MRTLLLSLLLLSCVTTVMLAQTTNAGGTWTTSSIWTGGVPGTGWTTINVGHTVTKNTSHIVNGTLNVTAGGSLTISGNVTMTNGSDINVYGNLVITGNLSLTANLKIFPGGTVTVNGSVTIVDATYLTIGTAAAGPPYASLIVKQNITSSNSGDILIDRNGRLALFGNFSSTSGNGTLITVRDGGQAYVNGTTTFTGTGDHLKNDNDGNPYYGFYSPNQPTYTQPGQGSNSNGAAGANTVQGISQIPTDFRNWLVGIPGSPLPVKLLSFSARYSSGKVILEWQTSREENFSHFEVEHAGPDLNFSAFDQVAGAGFTTDIVQKYSATHEAPLVGNNYYRLKAVDLDNSWEYFKVINVIVDEQKDVHVYANPSNGEFINIASNFAPDENTRVDIYSMSGVPVGRFTISTVDTRIEFGSHLSPGVYLVNYAGLDWSQTIRFVVK